MKKYSIALGTILIVMLFASTGCSTAKPSGAAVLQTDSLIAGNNWVFTATQMNPGYGRTRFLESGYELKLKGQQLTVYLPYTGRAYSGIDAYATKGPLDFTSTSFTLKQTKEKKQRTALLIEVKDITDVREFRLLVFPDGTASLDVQFNNHSPVSFTGKLQQLTGNTL